MDASTLWLDWIRPALAVGWGLASPVVALGVALYAGPLLRRGIEAVERRLGVQLDQASNDAIQRAVQNYVGVALGRVRAGTLTLADIRSGTATRDFLAYMAGSVPASIAHQGVPDTRLAAMLRGKFEASLLDSDLVASPGGTRAAA